MPTFSIVVPVFNKVSLTMQCLNGLLDGALPYDSEIIVVDDGSTDLTARLLAGYGERVRVLTHAMNTGFAMACNDGAAIARGDSLVFLNNDTIPQVGWLDALARYSALHPRAGLVGSKLLFPNGTVEHAGIVICQDLQPRHVYKGFPGDHPAVNKSRQYKAVTGACALIRRDVFERVGGFDSAFNNGYEDVDLCMRLGQERLEVHYCHESVLVHFEAVTRDALSPQEAQNHRLFHSRWDHWLRPDDVEYYLEDGLLKVGYGPLYPIMFEFSPMLGTLGGVESDRQAEQLLNIRAQQVLEFLKENIHLTVRLQEALLPK